MLKAEDGGDGGGHAENVWLSDGAADHLGRGGGNELLDNLFLLTKTRFNILIASCLNDCIDLQRENKIEIYAF